MNDATNSKVVPPIQWEKAPWLVFFHGISKKKRIQTFYTMSHSPSRNNVYIKSIPELRDKIIWASSHGWLIVCDFNEQNIFSLWDCVTSQSINLPSIHRPEGPVRASFFLSSPPTSASSVLYLFFGDQVFFCRPYCSSITWINQRFELDGEEIDSIYGHVVLNGIIYFWTRLEDYRVYLTSIEPVDEATNSIALKSLAIEPPISDYLIFYYRHNYLIESCGHIYCVNVYELDVNDKITRVDVWKLNLVSKEWVEVESLDGRAFFVDNGGCTWCWGSDDGYPTGIRGNCVYCIDYLNVIWCYNLLERSLTPICSHLKLVPNPKVICIWVNTVMPQNQRLESVDKEKQKMKLTKVINDDDLEEDERDKKEKGPFIELPQDMIDLISNHTHLFDLWNLRATCSTFRSLVPQWRSNNSLPLLILFKNDYGLCQVMDPSRDDSHQNHLQLDSDPYVIDFSKNGWLIMHTLCNGYFFKPFTKMWEDFPSCLPDDTNLRSIGFSTYPTSPDCVTVMFDSSSERIDIHYFQMGDVDWSRCEFPNNNQFEVGINSPVYLKGAFYVLDVSGRLGAFELVKGGDGKWQVYDKPPLRYSFSYTPSYHLLECDGELVAVFIGYVGEWVDIFKFNLSERTWLKLESLGDYSFFVGKSSFSVKITNIGMRNNRIYILRLKGSGMIFYSLKTKEFHVSGRNDSISDFCNTSQHMDSFWL